MTAKTNKNAIQDRAVEVRDAAGRTMVLNVNGDSIREAMELFGSTANSAFDELLDNAACNATDEGLIGKPGECLQIVREL